MSTARAHRRIALTTLLALALCTGGAGATPPCYKSFDRPQRLHHAPPPEDLLRIWIAFVDQGDGILIQLPERFAYDPDPQDDDPAPSERIEVLIDSGSFFQSDRDLMARFLARLYPEGRHRIEHVVLTHHDGDHVSGLAACLENERFAFGTLYHNGLASYRPEGLGLDPAAPKPEGLIAEARDGRLHRAMAFLDEGSGIEELREADLVPDRASLASRLEAAALQGVYEELADAVLNRSVAAPVVEFRRVGLGAGFIEPPEPGEDGPELAFELLWPPERPRRFGQWSETINGNSVTFRLRYGDFEMLFTGDQNHLSEEALLARFVDRPQVLSCDVLKVPHHGSRHNLKPFFEAADPVLGLASMGRMGFGASWRHPSEEVVSWLGGPHRAYHTFVHERRFRWAELVEDADRRSELVERTHVLVETDGTWFRVVELPADGDPAAVPSVGATARGDGTRWIAARADPATPDCLENP